MCVLVSNAIRRSRFFLGLPGCTCCASHARSGSAPTNRKLFTTVCVFTVFTVEKTCKTSRNVCVQTVHTAMDDNKVIFLWKTALYVEHLIKSKGI